ncbi:MAG: DUF503 domain-containing protein [Oligoflexia bacterium]|nr:DUF503 domain-containing protein [Oligoflexia bacterium]
MKTLVGIKRIGLLMPENSSLKEKRHIVRKLRDAVKSRFNVSFAEIDTDDKWQRTVVAVSMVSNSEELIHSAFLQISNIVENAVGVRVFNEHREIFCFEDQSESVWIPS